MKKWILEMELGEGAKLATVTVDMQDGNFPMVYRVLATTHIVRESKVSIPQETESTEEGAAYLPSLMLGDPDVRQGGQRVQQPVQDICLEPGELVRARESDV